MPTPVSRMFNDSVLNFNASAVTQVVGIAVSEGGTWVDVTQPEDANKLFEISTQPDFACKVKFKGGCAMTQGQKGALSITWKNGLTTTCPGTWQVGPINNSGDWDAPITGDVELRPTVPDAE